MQHLSLDQSKNIRNIIDLDDTELRASLQKSGWIRQFPAFADENGVLIVGHRRMKLAKELGIKPVIETIHFGNGSEGDVKRLELAIASNIGAAGLSKKDRQSIAAVAYQHGYTMEQIGKMLGVHHTTISRNLAKSNLCDVHKLKPAKTATNLKGAGRPRKPRKNRKVAPSPHYRADEVMPKFDAGMTKKEIAIETGIGQRSVDNIVDEERIRREAISKALSMTAQQKLEFVIKQKTQELEAKFDMAVNVKVREILLNSIGPRLRKEQDLAKRIIQSRKGIMDRKTYRAIVSCLHPDWVTDAKQKNRYEEAFRSFTRIEKLLLDERESPTDFTHIAL